MPPVNEPGLDELLAVVLESGGLRLTTDYAEVAGADVHLIRVCTPPREGENAADTSYLFNAGQSLAPEGQGARGREVHGSGRDGGAVA